jgi:P27 family predicted phage terminase small subunit
MPPDMDTEAKAVWRRVTSSMGKTGVIRVPDSHILRGYCEAVSRYAHASRLYAGSGPLVRHPGSLVKNPLHQIVRDDSEQIRLFARELGPRRASGRSPMAASSSAVIRWGRRSPSPCLHDGTIVAGLAYNPEAAKHRRPRLTAGWTTSASWIFPKVLLARSRDWRTALFHNSGMVPTTPRTMVTAL